MNKNKKIMVSITAFLFIMIIFSTSTVNSASVEINSTNSTIGGSYCNYIQNKINELQKRYNYYLDQMEWALQQLCSPDDNLGPWWTIERLANYWEYCNRMACGIGYLLDYYQDLGNKYCNGIQSDSTSMQTTSTILTSTSSIQLN